MPRSMRNSKKAADVGLRQKNSAEATVANVNKPASRVTMKAGKSKISKSNNATGKRKSNEKNVTQPAKKVKNVKPDGKGKEGNAKMKVPSLKIQDKYKEANVPKIIFVNGQPRFATEPQTEIQNFDQVAEANFVEGEKVIKFTVDAKEDQNFVVSESEDSESEVDLDSAEEEHSTTAASSDGELDNSD